ncbi:hypothetical protein [Phenylobacterium sp. J367]|uniref:hypothetical protein n=1 Tax=Phenylobacterium sp. J367 TaxID=2898435 RepID=UPI00215076E6|nr:hypothetical protein [Phenylobacterium sp. J367]MCR5878916.1 hypothetical protein [Phenylobacterium sp. J367]
MASHLDRERFLELAYDMAQLAEEARTPEDRDELLQLAKYWRERADQLAPADRRSANRKLKSGKLGRAAP